MSIVVQKYGGSSVADPEKLRAVAQRVVATQRLGYQVVVVVSAMGKTTDQLIGLSKQITPNPDRRELDMLLSTGERISMSLLTMAIREEGAEAISFTGSQAGILTNDRHVDARIIEVRPIRVLDELARGRIVIVAVYQGMSYKREITCLGRGGSDTTAVALAAALGAEWCEICSDVDGVYTSDPRVVPEATRIPRLSHEETQELAESGAKVLNAQAVEFAKQHDIAIYARATSGPLPGEDPSRDGTVVCRLPLDGARRVAAIAGERGLFLLRGEVRDPMSLWTALDDLKAGAKQTQIVRGPGAWRVAMVFAKENLHQAEAVRTWLRDRFEDPADLVEGFGAVSAVGAGMNLDFGNTCRGHGALDGIGVEELFTTTLRSTWILPDAQVEQAQRRLHHAFFATPE
jgi:aspartate kinase